MYVCVDVATKREQKTIAVESALKSTSNNFCLGRVYGKYVCVDVATNKEPTNNRSRIRLESQTQITYVWMSLYVCANVATKTNQKTIAVESALKSTSDNFCLNCFYGNQDYTEQKMPSHADACTCPPLQPAQSQIGKTTERKQRLFLSETP